MPRCSAQLSLDLLETLLAHALDLEQAFGLFVQHADGVRAEGGHDAPGHLLAHALDEARGQVQADAFAGGGQHLLGHVEGQLAAEARVVDPAAADPQLHPGLRVDHVAHAGHGIAAHRAAGRALDPGLHGQGPVGQQAQHGIAVLFVVEDHPFQRAGEFGGIGIAQQGEFVRHGSPEAVFGGMGSLRGKGDRFTAGKRAPAPATGQNQSTPSGTGRTAMRSCSSRASASTRAVMAVSTGTMRGMAARS